MSLLSEVRGWKNKHNQKVAIVKHHLDAWRPACGEGAVFKGALVGGRAGVGPLVPPEIAGGGEQLPTAGARVVLRLVVVQLVLVEIVLVAGLVTAAGDTATKHSFLLPLLCSMLLFSLNLHQT